MDMFLPERREIYFDLLARYASLYDKDKRHPLILGNPDWTRSINPLLKEWGDAYDIIKAVIDGPFPQLSEILAANLRIIIEIVYYLGYQHGLQSKRGHTGAMTFHVGKESEE